MKLNDYTKHTKFITCKDHIVMLHLREKKFYGMHVPMGIFYFQDKTLVICGELLNAALDIRNIAKRPDSKDFLAVRWWIEDLKRSHKELVIVEKQVDDIIAAVHISANEHQWIGEYDK